MKDFRYIPEGISPQGRPRVYFTCHPEDHDKFFDTIGKELLDRQNCTVFFLDGDTRADEVEDYEIRLGEMQLFVVPVTTKLLTKPCRAMDVDVPFALSHHIPVLPLMQESGLDELFTKKFGDLQYLDKTDADPTAISYDEKLTRYLNAVIVGDELAKQVRAAFDAYIFLSYRKKDRRYAQELMRLIHSNPMCRDIAIWYDEFLTPGENFNSAIRQALEKSDLFALAVTPNLINELNYILSTEYPMARELNKEILPAELLPTDREKLREMYEGIPEPVSADDRERLTERLLESVRELALLSNDSDPQHNFFIGLAYLSGIDVEVDHERAVKLITSAAEADYIPAIEKLVSMYTTGEGVKRDYDKAVEWQERLVAIYEKACQDAPGDDTARELISALWELGDALYDLRRLDQAKNAYEKLLQYSERFYREYDDKYYYRAISVAYNKLGDIAKAQGKLSDAEEYYRKSLEISEAIARATETVEARRDLSVAYEHLGIISEAEEHLDEAETYYRKGLEIRESLVREMSTVVFERDLSIGYYHIGHIAEAKGKFSKAEEMYHKSLVIIEGIAQGSGTVELRRDLSVCYSNIGGIAEKQGKLNKAEEWYHKSLVIDEVLAEETETIESFRDLSISYNRLGNIAKAQDDLGKAEEWYRRSLIIRESLAEKTGTIESLRDLAVSYNNVGSIAERKGKFDEAEDYYRKDLEINEKITQEKETVDSKRDLMVCYERLGDIMESQGKLSEAERLFRKSFLICEALAKETDTLLIKSDLALCYGRLGGIAEAQGKRKEAESYYRDGIEISKAIAYEVGTVDSYIDLAVFYYRLGRLLDDTVYLKQALSIWSKLAEDCPDVPMFRRRRDILDNLLRGKNDD